MGKPTLVGIWVLVCGGIASSADSDARKKYVEACARSYAAAAAKLNEVSKFKAAEVEKAEAILAAKKAGTVTGVDYFRWSEEKKQYIVRHASAKAKAEAVSKAEIELQDAQQDLEHAKEREKIGPSLEFRFRRSAGAMQVGQIGVFEWATGTPVIGKVRKIIDKQTILVKDSKFTYWVEVPSTAGMVDGLRFDLDKVYEVVGTKKYLSSTLFHLRPFELTAQEKAAIRASVKNTLSGSKNGK